MYKRYWMVSLDTNGFQSKFLMYGKETDIQKYMISELGGICGYSGATEKEVEAAKILHIKAYIAPEYED